MAERDPLNRFHIGWEWHAHMWFVEHPEEFPGDAPEDLEWFNTYAEALEYVEKQFREMPVQYSLVDDIPPPPVKPNVPDPTPTGEPGSYSAEEPVAPYPGIVRNPISEDTVYGTPREARVAEYAQMVGL